MKAVVLAAGQGTRINTGRIIVPKPLYSIGRRALIEHAILNLKQAGIDEFVIIVGFMAEHIKEQLKDGTALGVSISYLDNPEFEKEVGVSALLAREAVPDERFLLTMADHVIDPEITGQLRERMKTSDRCILCVDRKLSHVNDIESATKVLEKDGFIASLGWHIEEYNCIDCGLFGMTPRIFDGLVEAQRKGKWTLSDGVTELIRQEGFPVLDIGDRTWTGVNTRSDLIFCEDLIEKQGWRADGQ